ncbi:MAG: hypothetical protein II656_01070, partial [Ruminococcus sp.]|nr:hypothetical protein [Ruminococcus sp.]
INNKEPMLYTYKALLHIRIYCNINARTHNYGSLCLFNIQIYQYYLKKENEELKAENDLLKDKLFSLADEAIELKKKQTAVNEDTAPEPAESASEDKKIND